MVARIFLMAAFAIEIVQFAWGLADPDEEQVSLAIAGGTASLIGMFGLLLYVKQLALRVPDHNLAKQTMVVMGGLAYLVIGAIMSRTGRMFSSNVSTFLTCGYMVALLVFPVWATILAIIYSRTFQTAAKTARRSWARQRRVQIDSLT